MDPTLTERLGAIVTPDLLKVLDELYPLCLPDPNHSDRQIWMKVGARQLVDVLHAKHAEANDSLL